jgi:hypothetical protein
VIEQTGPGVTRVKAGDRVACSYIPVCGTCRYCSTGHQNLCDAGKNAAIGCLVDGTFRFHDGQEDLGGMCVLGTFSERAARGGGWQSTSGPAPMIVVNGPVRHELGFNTGGGAFGPGFRPNATIPRAIGPDESADGEFIRILPSPRHVPIVVAGARNAAISMVVRVFGEWSGTATPVEQVPAVPVEVRS